MVMRRLQITANIKSSSGMPGVNISQRLPTSLCFSFASYKAIKQGRKRRRKIKEPQKNPNKTTKQQKTFPVSGKPPLSWQQAVLRSTLQHCKLLSPSGCSDHCPAASLPPIPTQILLLTLCSSMLTTTDFHSNPRWPSLSLLFETPPRR